MTHLLACLKGLLTSPTTFWKFGQCLSCPRNLWHAPITRQRTDAVHGSPHHVKSVQTRCSVPWTFAERYLYASHTKSLYGTAQRRCRAAIATEVSPSIQSKASGLLSGKFALAGPTAAAIPRFCDHRQEPAADRDHPECRQCEEGSHSHHPSPRGPHQAGCQLRI